MQIYIFSCLKSFQVIAENFETSCQFSVDFPVSFSVVLISFGSSSSFFSVQFCQFFVGRFCVSSSVGSASHSVILRRFLVHNFVIFQWVGSLSLSQWLL